MNTFEIVSGKIVCSDPCYPIPVWCQGIVENVKNGTWIADVSKDGSRIARLSIRHSECDSFYLDRQTKLDFDCGVDSGQFGFFDHTAYRNDASAHDLPKIDFNNPNSESGDDWYRACCKITLEKKAWGIMPYGVVSSSGHGDGSYDVKGVKNDEGLYVAFSVDFISDEYDD